MFNIITACSRPQNLERIKQSISEAHIEDCHWIIVHDTTEARKLFNEYWITEFSFHDPYHHVGNEQKNYGLNMCKDDDIVYFLDDDTLLHPNISKAVDLLRTSSFEAVVFDQILEGNLIRTVSPSTVKVYQIDQGQFMTRVNLCKWVRLDPEKYEADGIFIEYIYNNHSDRFGFINEPLCYYNKLRWKDENS